MEETLTSLYKLSLSRPVQPGAPGQSGADWQSLARTRLDELTKPPGSLGRLEEIATRIVSIQGRLKPTCKKKTVYVFAADHGVAEEGVSAYPQQVTQQMVANFLAGGAAINVLARLVGAEVVVVDVGINAEFEPGSALVRKKVRRGTRNFVHQPAMTEGELLAALEVGRELTKEPRFRDSDLVAVGEMGIGNTTSAAAITAALSAKPVCEVTGFGTGISAEELIRKQRTIEKALQLHRTSTLKPVDLLRTMGGLELAAIAGMVLGAWHERKAVVIDGFISSVATAIACALEPRVKEVLFAGHLSEEPGHRVLLEMIGLAPILNLGMRLGEATGAALAMVVIESAVRIFNEMATFSSAGVSGPTT